MKENKMEEDKIKISNTNKVIVHLDQLTDWEFHYQKKVYKLNVKELLKLIEEIKK